MAEFKDRFKELREEKDLSQRELALLLNFDQSLFSKYETGERKSPSLATAGTLAAFFGVSIDYLLGRTDVRDAGNDRSTQPAPPPDAAALAKQAILEAPDRAKALLRLSAWDSKFSPADDEILAVIRQIHDKYGDMEKRGGKAAHGPAEPGTGALR